MKKTFLTIAIMTSLLSSCNHSNKEEPVKEQETTEQDSTEKNSHETTTDLESNWKNDIELDAGKKWIANMETNKGVQKMKDVLKSQPTVTIDDYHKLASELTTAKNYIIKECTMKGASHDNLHVWLLPLLDKLDVLTEVTTLETASKIKQNISEHIFAYELYFQ
tara:strand:+ start:469 stop:960 length:492 start_codon:yes stop_codon:yes gene_type:complete